MNLHRCVRLLFALLLVTQPLLKPATAVRAHSTENIHPSAIAESTAATEATARAVVDANYGKLPLSFEVNRGQANPDVKFLTRAGGSSLLLKSTEAVLTLSREEKLKTPAKKSIHPLLDEAPVRQITSTVTMKLVGANPYPRIVGLEEQQAKSSYFTGSDPKQWTTDVPNYAKVKYEQVYPGIDLIFYGNPQQLEYDFVVAPGADPKQIRLSFDGAKKMKIEENGDVALATDAGEVRQRKPVIFQLVNGERQKVVGKYARLGKEQIGLEIGNYDTSKTLVIDPVFAYATFFGSRPGTAIAVDKDGNTYVAAAIPATAGAYRGGNALSVAKLNATGTAVIYAATFGTSQDDRIFDLAVDAVGSCYVVGRTESLDFPTTVGAFQTDFGRVRDNNYNGFVLKLNAAGNGLAYSTFLKGDMPMPLTESKVTQVRAIAVDAQGNAYVTGSTNTTDFPTTPGVSQPTIATYPTTSGGSFPPTDPFVTKLNPTGTALIYSTFLGSASNAEEGKDIAVDQDGNVYVTGLTTNGLVDVRRPRGNLFPITPGAYQTTDTIGSDGSFIVNYAFVSKFNASGTSLVFSTILGSIGVSSAFVGIAVDNNRNVYVTGSTRSPSFPTTPSVYQAAIRGSSPVPQDAFVAKLNPVGSALIYSTYLGGVNGEDAYGIAVDSETNVHIAGFTASPDFPQIGLPPQTIGFGEDGGGFVAKLNVSGNTLIQSIFMKRNVGYALALDSAGNAYIAGQAGLIQPTPNAYQSAESDGMVVKITSPRSFATVSAASYVPDLASETIASAFGSGLATATQLATVTPLPTTLAGTTVKVRDSAGTERDAPLFFVSPTQINYQVPPSTATGVATLTVSSGDEALSVTSLPISSVAPGLFTADASGRGVPAAVALRVKADGTQSFEPVARFDPVLSRIVAVPIDLGAASDQVFLILNGTGIRFRSNLSAVSAKAGGVEAPVLFAGEQGGFVGLDQINLLLPRMLMGRGEVDVILTVDGKAANTVRINIK